MIAYATLTVLPSIDELGAMWPAWLCLAAVGALYIYCEIKDRQEWNRYRHRMKRREMADRIKSRQNSRN